MADTTTHIESSPTQHARRFTRYSLLVTRYALLIIILVAFFLRVSSITFQSLWRDEVDAIRFAMAPLSDLLKTLTQPGYNGPLYFLMLRGWIGVAGQSEFALRFPSLIFGVISVALIFILGRRLFNRSIGLIAAILFTFSAYQVWYSQEAKMYTLITALALAAIYFLRRGIEEGQTRYWISMVVATSLAMYAHILAALLIPVEAALFILWWRISRKQIRAGLIAFALLTVPYIPLAGWELPLVFQPAETGFAHYTFVGMLNTLGSAYTVSILTPLIDWSISLVVGVSAMLAIWGVLESKFAITHRLALLLWLALPFLAIFVVSINRPLFTDRYLIWIEAAYYLLISIGLYALWCRWKPIGFAGLIGLVFVSTLSINAQATTPFKSDFRSAAQAIEREIKPTDAIIFQIPYVHYVFDYYFHQPYRPIDGPYTNYPGDNNGYRDSEDTVFQSLTTQFQNQHSVWLVLSEEEMWDRRHLLRQWLNSHGTVTYHAIFAQVEITCYQLNSP